MTSVIPKSLPMFGGYVTNGGSITGVGVWLLVGCSRASETGSTDGIQLGLMYIRSNLYSFTAFDSSSFWDDISFTVSNSTATITGIPSWYRFYAYRLSNV